MRSFSFANRLDALHYHGEDLASLPFPRGTVEFFFIPFKRRLPPFVAGKRKASLPRFFWDVESIPPFFSEGEGVSFSKEIRQVDSL